jgi:hypothetical protein
MCEIRREQSNRRPGAQLPIRGARQVEMQRTMGISSRRMDLLLKNLLLCMQVIKQRFVVDVDVGESNSSRITNDVHSEFPLHLALLLPQNYARSHLNLGEECARLFSV